MSNKLPFPKKIPVCIRSESFQGCLVRMQGITPPPDHPTGGFGVVNLQAERGDNPWELFNFQVNSDNTISFESFAYPGNFLRMQGQTPGPEDPIAGGYGTVNCQSGGAEDPLINFNLHVRSVDAARGVPVWIESNAFPGNYLQMAVNTPPPYVFNPDGFGVVNCQVDPDISPYTNVHLGAVLHESIKKLLAEYNGEIDPEWKNPTPKQIEEMIASILERKEILDANIDAKDHPFGFIAYTDKELAEIAAIRPEDLTSCQMAWASLIIDTLLFVLGLCNIYISKAMTNINAVAQKMTTAVTTALEKTMLAMEHATTALAKANALFGFISQLFKLSCIWPILKAVFYSFSWFSAICAVIVFIAQVIAWVSTGGWWIVAQVVMGIIGFAIIVTDIVGVVNRCGNLKANTVEAS
ncbi:MAG: hypothetical protein ACKVT2_17940 [Saprospiraceae bacterium]